jgi:hypothetical protein
MRELKTVEDFKLCLKSGTEFILITDNATGNRVHTTRCGHISLPHFTKKVITNGCKNGKYYAITDLERGMTEMNAAKCAHCWKCNA